MNKNRLRHLAGLTEDFDPGAVQQALDTISDALVAIQDELYDYQGENRDELLSSVSQASTALDPVRFLISR
jgi:hypothetical protein